MEFQKPIETSPEFLANEVFISTPAVESLLDPSRTAEVWPEDITGNEKLLEQVNRRRELIESLDDISDHIPQPSLSIEEAINQGQINEDSAERLYRSLSDMLVDEDYRRLLLYLPFEFLPQKSWRPSGEHLQQAIDIFKSEYLAAWRSLLTTHDVRANFVDGDVIEVEQRTDDLPRVVKAAHLIPKLVQSGLIEISDVIGLMEESDDQVLKSSIADAIPVAADLGLITEENILRMKSSSDPLVNGTANIITSETTESETLAETVPGEVSLSIIHEKLEKAHADTEAEMPSDITEKRRTWLRGTRMQRTTDKLADGITAAILSDLFLASNAEEFLSPESGSECQEVLVEGVRKAIESEAANDPEKAQVLYENFSEVLNSLYSTNNTKIKQLCAKAYRRLYGLGVVGDDQLEQLNISVPRLNGPVSENMKSKDSELREIGTKIISAANDPETASIIYPVALVYGSKLKGYGESDSDLDTAVFIKPGTPAAKSSKLRELIPGAFEFWLEAEGDHLKIHDFPAATDQYGSSYWTYMLFGGAWVGSEAATRELHQKLLVSYMHETDDELYDRNVRSLWLEEMEKGDLQYSLMHKGYERFAPHYGGIDTPHADKIDGESMFWDSGYRRTATQLYARRVFLPKLAG